MRPLHRVPVPPGPDGVLALVDPVRAALDGSGPAIAPIPVASATVSATYTGQLAEAIHPDDPANPLESDDIAVVLATSGSTGAPRGVLLTANAIASLAPQITTPVTRWIAALPLHSMGGFNVLVRALTSGHPPIGVASLGGATVFTASDFARARDGLGDGDVRTSLVAAQLRRLLDDAEGVHALQSCTQILIGGGPLPAPLRRRAEELGIAITSTYGATETSGGCVYDGRPLAGVEVAIADSGEVLLRGPMLAKGYRNDPRRTVDRFTVDGYRTGDAGRFDDGVLVIDGRLDDIVIVNGVNVSLGAIERVAEQVTGVLACAAVAATSATAEPEISLAVVSPTSGSLEAIRAALREHLGREAVPRRVELVDALPHLPNGKLDRAALRRWATEGR